MKKKKVMLYIPSFNPYGGIERYLTSLIPYLKVSGIQFVICSQSKPEPDNQYAKALHNSNVKVYSPLSTKWFSHWNWHITTLVVIFIPLTLPIAFIQALKKKQSLAASLFGMIGFISKKTSPFTPKWISYLPIWILLTLVWLRFRPNIIHILRVEGIPALKWAVFLKIPVLYTEALEPGGDAYYPYLKPFYLDLVKDIHRIQIIITQSNRVRQKIIDQWKVDPSKLRIIPWVVDVKGSERVCFKDTSNMVTFGTAGRIAGEKDLYTLLQAAQLIVSNYPHRVRFIIAGGGPLLEDIKQYASELHIEGNVVFTGPYEAQSLPEIFQMFDVFIISSLTEGAPLAVIEAMAYSKPIIATDVAGTGELLEEGRNGLLVPPQDPGALFVACEKFLLQPDMIQQMGQYSRFRYKDKFDPQKITNQLITIYNQNFHS